MNGNKHKGGKIEEDKSGEIIQFRFFFFNLWKLKMGYVNYWWKLVWFDKICIYIGEQKRKKSQKDK